MKSNFNFGAFNTLSAYLSTSAEVWFDYFELMQTKPKVAHFNPKFTTWGSECMKAMTDAPQCSLIAKMIGRGMAFP